MVEAMNYEISSAIYSSPFVLYILCTTVVHCAELPLASRNFGVSCFTTVNRIVTIKKYNGRFKQKIILQFPEALRASGSSSGGRIRPPKSPTKLPMF